MFKNSIALLTETEEVPIGDPFVLRHNGKYYLYPSTRYGYEGILCFTSSNLVDWTYEKLVVENDALIKGAYAPEVIYAYGAFYMTTSPDGHGHYILKADNPLGPFKRITDNIGEMIDGTFILDSKQTLYFARADHRGITINQIDNKGNISHRKDIVLPTGGWTEGPYFIKEKALWYMTYCANFVLSQGYHIDYATTKELNGDYRVGINNPMIVSTKKEFNSLGHSMMVLAPDLRDYYTVYHHLFHTSPQDTFRRVAIDRLQINGRLLATNASNHLQDKPDMPYFYTYEPLKNGFNKRDDAYISPSLVEEDFVAEFNFLDQAFVIYVDYLNEIEHKSITFSDHTVTVSYQSQVYRYPHTFDFDHFKTVRLKRVNEVLDIYIDFVYVMSIPITAQKGYLGFKTNNQTVGYIAYNNLSNINPYIQIPGSILPQIYDKSYDVDTFDDTGYLVYQSGCHYTHRINVEKNGIYQLSVYGKFKESMIDLKINGQMITLSKCDSTYEYMTYDLGLIELMVGKQELIFEMQNGTLYQKAIRIETMDTQLDDTVEHKLGMPKVTWLTKGKFRSFELTFTYDDIIQYKRYGMLINTTHYSTHSAQTEHSYCGYFIGFRDTLLVVDRAAYGLERLYDMPTEVKPKEKIKLKVEINAGYIKVFLNGKYAFSTYDKWAYLQGAFGIYQDYGVSGTYINHETK